LIDLIESRNDLEEMKSYLTIFKGKVENQPFDSQSSYSGQTMFGKKTNIDININKHPTKQTNINKHINKHRQT